TTACDIRLTTTNASIRNAFSCPAWCNEIRNNARIDPHTNTKASTTTHNIDFLPYKNHRYNKHANGTDTRYRWVTYRTHVGAHMISITSRSMTGRPRRSVPASRFVKVGIMREE